MDEQKALDAKRGQRYFVVRLVGRGAFGVLYGGLLYGWGLEWWLPAWALSALIINPPSYMVTKWWAFEMRWKSSGEFSWELLQYLAFKLALTAPAYGFYELLTRYFEVRVISAGILTACIFWPIFFLFNRWQFTGSWRDFFERDSKK